MSTESATKWKNRNPEKVKEINRKGQKKRRDRDREAYNEYMREYRKKNKDSINNCTRIRMNTKRQTMSKDEAMECTRSRMIRSAKYSAKKKHVSFDLKTEDIELPTHCPVFGIELDYQNTTRQDNSPSLDRTHPNRGYVKGNVVVMSWRANNLKKNATGDEIIKLAAYMECQ